MDRASANKQSLANHLALVACRCGHGNGHLINELMRAVYLGWFLQRAGYGAIPVEQFRITEYAVEATLAHAHECGEWWLPEEAIADFEVLLALYDAQLASASLPWADLAICCPRGERYGISTFRLQKYVNLGVCCRPGSTWVTRAYLSDAAPTSVTVLVQA